MDKALNTPAGKGEPVTTSRRISLTRITRRRYLLFLMLVAPAFLLRIATAAYPIVQTILQSFTNFDIIKNTHSFIGLQNYQTILGDFQVHSAVYFTALLVVLSTVGDLVAGMLIALLLDSTFRCRRSEEPR